MPGIAAQKLARPPKSSHRERGRRGVDAPPLPLIVDPASGRVLPMELIGAREARAVLSDKRLPPTWTPTVFAVGLAVGRFHVVVLDERGISVEPPSRFRVERRTADRLQDARRVAWQKVIERTIQALRLVQARHPGAIAEDQLIREVGESLVDQVPQAQGALSVEDGWQQLLERGLHCRTQLLASKAFKTTEEAGELLGIGEQAVRRRIREGKLFAIQAADADEHRVPVWALDPQIAGARTAELVASVPGVDDWWLYHFMSTPAGHLHGLRPFECLLSTENLPASTRLKRNELRQLRSPSGGDVSMLDLVRIELLAEFSEGPSE